MAKKKTATPDILPQSVADIHNQLITDTIEKNYMPYVMSVIVSRAIPEIDGFKPSHRKLLFTMYKMGLLTGHRTKSANVVGQTMRLNPHGDGAIYETMVRLTRGNGTLIHPFVDSKGSFGKHYSSDMKYAASRYTEVKLDEICAELFKGIDKNAVEFTDNYDSTMKEPVLLPSTFPNILVTPNTGIAVGMASNICSFNLAEICDGTIALIRNPNLTVDKFLDIVPAPDFSGAANIIYDREVMKSIYQTGNGSVRMRAKYVYDKANNCIDILEIPYSTTIEQIMKKITDLVKEGKIKDITDFRDEIDLSGFKLTIDLRRGTDPDKLMTKLFKMTPLEDSYKCNFNVLIDATPRLLGVIDILNEWIKFRVSCLRRELSYDLEKKEEKLHLLMGLGKILLDIDKAIRIIRETSSEAEVVPNLCDGFKIDKIQADFIADIKLRNLNREHILNKIKEIETLQNDIAELKDIIGDDFKTKSLIIKQLQEVKKKYGKPRKTKLIYSSDIEEYNEEDFIDNFQVRLILTKEGYFKKITHASLRSNDEQKLKDGDSIIFSEDSDNISELIFFTDKAKAYKAKVSEFDTVKSSLIGDFLPAKLGMEENERPIFLTVQNPDQYPPNDNLIFVFDNGKGVKVPISAYQTKTNRRKLINAYSDASPIVSIIYEKSEPINLMLISNVDRAIIVDSSLIPLKTTRSSSGIALLTLKKGQTLSAVRVVTTEHLNFKKYFKNKLPATGVILTEKDIEEQQLTII